MMKNTISIIMPVYKVEQFIEKAIQSVLAQTYEHFELLIIDDGSPDNSIDIARKYEKEDPRVHTFRKENGGLSDARNYGLTKAQGEFIYFIDSDDWIEPDLLKKSVTAIQKDHSDVVIFGYYLDTEDVQGHITAQQKVHGKKITVDKHTAKNLPLNNALLNLMGYAWNKLYRTSFLRTSRLTFEKGVSLVEDILFNAKVYQHAHKISFIKAPLYHYINRQRETLIKTYHKDAFELNLKKHAALKSLFDFWEVDKEKKQKILANSLVTGIQYCVNNIVLYDNSMDSSERKEQINKILQHTETKKYIDWYTPKTKSDRLYKKLIKYRLVTILMYIKTWKKAA